MTSPASARHGMVTGRTAQALLAARLSRAPGQAAPVRLGRLDQRTDLGIAVWYPDVPALAGAFAIASNTWLTGDVSPVRVSSIGEYIREQREQAKISLRQLASAAGVSNPYLSQIERGLRRPSAEILQQIAKGLRISAEVLYVQAGILEERGPDSGVRAAVLADPGLAERQKQVLLDIYESFRRETALNTRVRAAGPATAGGSPATGWGAAAGGPVADLAAAIGHDQEAELGKTGQEEPAQ
jgi:transcriptional regulator with XRE-family HTH domain